MARRISFSLAICFWLLPALAHATTYTVTGDNWDPWGAVSFVEGQNGPYQVHLSSSAIADVAITAPPWNTNGNGHYLDIPNGSTTIPNAGPGAYFTPGNPQAGWLFKFWFKAVTLPVGGSAKDYFLRLNDSGGQTYGNDTVADYINPSGQFVLVSGTTTNTLTANTWYAAVYCYQYGSGSNGSEALYINGVSWLSNTGLGAPATGKFSAANFNFDNESFNASPGGEFQFGPWLLYNINNDSCTTAITNVGTANLFSQTLYPISNNAVAWTPSAGTNWSNVNCAGGCAGYNSTATQGLQDIYNLATGTIPNSVVAAIMVAQAKTDALGDRVVLPTWKNGSGTVLTGSLQNSLNPNATAAAQTSVMANGTYYTYMDAESVSVFTSSAWVASELAKTGITLGF